MELEKHDEIIGMVRDQLQRTNPPSTEALYGRAVRIDESVRELTLRQFHARFPLRVHRERAREKDESGLSAAPATSGHDRSDSDRANWAVLYQLFHDVARDVAGLSSGPEVIDWVAGRLESYVDRAADALVPEEMGEQ